MTGKLITWLSLVLILLLPGLSCSDKEEKDTLPDLPPQEALLMDFSAFIDNPAQEGLKSTLSIDNALYSYVTAIVWHTLVNVPMIIPVAAYLESFNHTPVYLGDNSWQWSYSWAGAVSYSARLVTTRISNEEFRAEMFITQTGSYVDFKWFQGIVRYDRTHALWTMYEPPTQETMEIDTVGWLSIEWNMDWEQEVSDITYTIIKEDHQEYGSYITYGIVDNDVFDAFYTISHSQKTTYIEWNRTTKEGRVKDEVNFGDSDWHCWDAYLQDTDCN